ncbi:MAG: outer membrane beta-barrel protein [Bacteroidia bacterium]|nr:outer membrane beta-barrel protein [Bacteroidia bacterium]
MVSTFRHALATLLLLVSVYGAQAQKISMRGMINDTTEHKPLAGAVILSLRLSDSLLVAYTRSASDGTFRFDSLPVDTYQVVISHPRFGDQVFIVLPDGKENDFDLKKIILPPKTVELTEVNIVGYADAVFYNGDTLIYNADSFKVAANAVVEDLLKKLPGIKVDKSGKIYSQGKAIDQVLVDGDEFFGSDQTIATKNLAAKSIDQVQVYEKKNEDANENSDKETLQVLNLKLKEEAKKGYFGRVSAAGGLDDFYQGDLLLNRFNGKQKISLYALTSNTPHTGFDWREINEYGLDNEYNRTYDDDGGSTTWWGGNPPPGIPRTFKTGIYYSDMITKTTKVNFNYGYLKSDIASDVSTASQYFLSDTTYRTNKFQTSKQQAENHSANLSIKQTLDSLTDLTLESKYKFAETTRSSFENNHFLSAANSETRSTEIENDNTSDNTTMSNALRLRRSFKNRERSLYAYYTIDNADNNADGIQKSLDHSFTNTSLPDSVINQKKISAGTSLSQKASITYTEPLSKKFKVEFQTDNTRSNGTQDKKTLDYSGSAYDIENAAYTNSFKTERTINRFGTKLSYELKKYTFSVGTRLRQIDADNTNMVSGEKISQTLKSVLPYSTFWYKFSDNQRIWIRYRTESTQPDVNQLQPVPDNSNPNYVRIGNPDLLPTFTHAFDFNFNSYKPVSGRNIWSNIHYQVNNDAFANLTSYDSLGRTISQTVNTNGSKSAYGYLNFDIPMFEKKLSISPDFFFRYGSSVNYINEKKNVTETFSPNFNLNIRVEIDTFEFSLGGSYAYDKTSSTLNAFSNETINSHSYNASLSLELPLKFKIETDVEYEFSDKRAAGYNSDFILWNATLTKTFFKSKNLSLFITANDLLDQNTNLNRQVQDNVISDTRSNVIGRYFMLNLVFRFNSNKKEEDESGN